MNEEIRKNVKSNAENAVSTKVCAEQVTAWIAKARDASDPNSTKIGFMHAAGLAEMRIVAEFDSFWWGDTLPNLQKGIGILVQKLKEGLVSPDMLKLSQSLAWLYADLDYHPAYSFRLLNALSEHAELHRAPLKRGQMTTVLKRWKKLAQSSTDSQTEASQDGLCSTPDCARSGYPCISCGAQHCKSHLAHNGSSYQTPAGQKGRSCGVCLSAGKTFDGGLLQRGSTIVPQSKVMLESLIQDSVDPLVHRAIKQAEASTARLLNKVVFDVGKEAKMLVEQLEASTTRLIEVLDQRLELERFEASALRLVKNTMVELNQSASELIGSTLVEVNRSASELISNTLVEVNRSTDQLIRSALVEVNQGTDKLVTSTMLEVNTNADKLVEKLVDGIGQLKIFEIRRLLYLGTALVFGLICAWKYLPD